MAESRTSTAPPDVPVERVRAARTYRRIFFLVVCAVLVAAAAGLAGVRSKQVRASGGGYDLAVSYDDITRGGLSTTLELTIRRAGGFPSPVTLAVSSAFLDRFDTSGVEPEPARATATAEDAILTFDPPKTGDTMTVSFDLDVRPGIRLRRAEGRVAILDGNDQAVVSVPVGTAIRP